MTRIDIVLRDLERMASATKPTTRSAHHARSRAVVEPAPEPPRRELLAQSQRQVTWAETKLKETAAQALVTP